MKAIIIDDEKHVRDGLLLLAQWDKYGIDTVFEAEDGDEAIKLISEHRPELIFTDMRMPKKDGISLLKWLHSSNIRSKTIVISGYEDYEYMRTAIHYNSFDFIMKPIDPEILNETLEKAVNEWREQEHLRKSQIEKNKVINEVKSLYWDRLFSGLLTQSQTSQAKIEKEYNVKFNQEQFQFALFDLSPMITKQFQADTELAFFTYTNICNELLQKDNSGVSFRNLHKTSEFVMLFWKNKHVLFLIEEIFSKIYHFSKINFTIALGQPSKQVYEAYESAQQTYFKHNLLEWKRIVRQTDSSSQIDTQLLDYSQELMWAIKSRSTEQMDILLNSIFQKIEDSNGFTLEQINNWEREFEQLRKSWLKEYNIIDQNPINRGIDYWKEGGIFCFLKFKEEKRNQFHNLIETLSNAKYQKEKNNMQQIEEYLRSNYQEDINLQELTDRFFLSREYISRKFKQEFNETITDYLMKIRMEKAKELLVNEHLKIYEVAYNVGYQNEKYFSKVFKKTVGLTPNEYRNSLT